VATAWAVVSTSVLVTLAAATADQPEAVLRSVTTTTAVVTTTTREHIAPTTTATTEPAALRPIPDPTAPVPDLAVAPAQWGGLSAWGAGVFGVDELLSRVEVRPEADAAGYDRALFGGSADEDGDGCDTRAEVLQAESSTPVQLAASGCEVVTGRWLSIYDGYSTPDASELEVDHLVALAEAWRSGASEWSPVRRAAFANDLGHPGALVAVTAAMNQSKGDRDPAEWQPPNRAAWCVFAADWVTVKARWQLSMDAPEATAVRNMLNGCGQPPTTTTQTTAPPPPPTTIAPVAPQPVVGAPVAPSGGCDPSYPGVCIPPAPPDLDCPQISHREFAVVGADPHGFDGDRDGVGCES
jgi:hypothetical protein